MSLSHDEIRSIVKETLAEQNRQPPDDSVVMKTIATILTSFGIDEDDRKELRADFQHLRKWRKSVEQAQSLTFKTVVGVIASGLLAALWMGAKAMIGVGK